VSSSATIATISKDWVEFFDAKTPTSQRVGLLQNGSGFQSVLAADSGSVLARAASAKVLAVKLDSASRATVTYDIVVAGTPALQDQKGVALDHDGVWEVGDGSFCALLHLQGGKLPKACTAALSASGAG
jgi:hypothetical protein